MEKEFVDYKIALALKELGFDEPCLKYVWNDKKHSQWMHNSSGSRTYHHQKEFTENSKIFTISVPTYQQAFRWFREKYNIISVIGFYNDGEEWEDTEYKVTISEFEHFATHDTFVKEGYVTYEEAELECLKKLIEIVKEK